MSDSAATRQLAEDQLAAFDREFVTDVIWEAFASEVRKDFPDGIFSFIDLGGGNGVFADRVLRNFPKSTGTVLDNAPSLLEKNVPHERKTVVLGGIEQIESLLPGRRFDVVCFNWVLHHLVGSTHEASTKHQCKALQDAAGLLSPNGRISVIENFYDGWLFDALPGRVIFELTASKALAGLIRSMGANTAGVGVCFRSRNDWHKTMSASGLSVRNTQVDYIWRTSLPKKALLHIGTVRCGHVWSSPTRR
jgi:SAM-dependent methyltransferase